MGEVMTMKEIERKYDQEWVLLGDPVSGEDDWVIEGRLLYHSPDRDEMYDHAMEIAPKHFAVLFVGEPKDAPVLML